MHILFKTLTTATLLISTTISANTFKLSSKDINTNEFMSSAQEFNGFGCKGSDLSPHLIWSNAPEGTKSFAVTVFDPDAPTGSGWWHWQIVNIPASVNELKVDAGSTKESNAPEGSLQIKNDYGKAGFGGACPPEGHGTHRYQFTVYALSVEKFELPKDASGALTGYMINAKTIESSTIEALYKRDKK